MKQLITKRMNLLMMQRYGEKPSIPNIPSDFFLTTRDTP